MKYIVKDPKKTGVIVLGKRVPNGSYEPGDGYYDLARKGHGFIRHIKAVPDAPKKSRSAGGDDE